MPFRATLGPADSIAKRDVELRRNTFWVFARLGTPWVSPVPVPGFFRFAPVYEFAPVRHTLVVTAETFADNPWGALPGADLVYQGIEDLKAGVESAEALLVSVGKPELQSLGVEVPEGAHEVPEHALYAHLAKHDSNTAHGRYNALVQRLVSFERALACANR